MVLTEQVLTFYLSVEGFEDHANCFITNLLRRESINLFEKLNSDAGIPTHYEGAMKTMILFSNITQTAPSAGIYCIMTLRFLVQGKEFDMMNIVFVFSIQCLFINIIPCVLLFFSTGLFLYSCLLLCMLLF